jgi:hypothetical protein
MKWRVVLVGKTAKVQSNSAFELLYSFPTREEAEAHAECFRFAGTKIVPCGEPAIPAEGHESEADCPTLRRRPGRCL